MLQGAASGIFLIGWDFDTRIHLSDGRRWWQRMWKREHPAAARAASSSGCGATDQTRNSHPQMVDRLHQVLRPRDRCCSTSCAGVATAHRVQVRQRASVRLQPPPEDRRDRRRLAVCGGIDMTSSRWDTREHLEDDPRRQTPDGNGLRSVARCDDDDGGRCRALRWASSAASAGSVPAGGRWRRSTDSAGDSAVARQARRAQFEDVEIGIARTRAAYGDDPRRHEIEELFVEQIARAKQFIYAESQYFASRAVAEAICQRLAEPDPPEIVVVHAEHADGLVEQAAMDTARAPPGRHAGGARRPASRLHWYVPYTGETPIYVHAKMMIVDDEILRIGSANFNNRSMGLDSECDVFIDCARPAQRPLRRRDPRTAPLAAGRAPRARRGRGRAAARAGTARWRR